MLFAGLCLLAISQAAAFSASVRGPPGAASAGARRATALTMQMPSFAQVAEGLHGTGSRFMPLQQMKQQDYLPRILRIAGMYPGISAAEIAAVKAVPPQTMGNWVYDFTDEASNALGVVAVPGCEPVKEAADPVAVICTSTSLGILLEEEAECIAVIDRSDVSFNSEKFFAFAAPDTGLATICWQKQQPADWPILGRVVYVMIPFLSYMAKKKSGFAEDSDEDI